ncbi:hypothetical protein ES695_08000 [Candidatus Atribacteria bacterium 1244-E10-H5-B2]|nr:MAG: hypothetical protein ES695_08000 [Candidatus Atribacteria bacterium 1244-E10-H5-B2]
MGVEFVYILKNLGAEVTIIELLDQIPLMAGEKITEEVTKSWRDLG